MILKIDGGKPELRKASDTHGRTLATKDVVDIDLKGIRKLSMKINTLFFFANALLLFIAFSSCSDGLSRSYAAKKIKEFYSYPNTMYDLISREVEFGEDWGPSYETYKQFERAGLLIMDRSINKLTENGRKYIYNDKQSDSYYSVVLAKRDFNEITGITYGENKNLARVDFSVTLTDITPFGQVKGLKDTTTLLYSVKMRKYDDGWRVEGKKE